MEDIAELYERIETLELEKNIEELYKRIYTLELQKKNKEAEQIKGRKKKRINQCKTSTSAAQLAGIEL